MEIRYRHNVKNNYMCIENDNILIKDYRLNMILKNHIRNLLEISATCVDGKFQLSYLISAKQSVKNIFEHKKMKYKEIKLLISGIYSLLQELPEYLLNPDDVILRFDMIFMDYEFENIGFAYFPGNGKNFLEEIKRLSQEILTITDHNDKNAVSIAYQFFDICNDSEFELKSLQKCIDDSVENQFTKIDFCKNELNYYSKNTKNSENYDDNYDDKEGYTVNNNDNNELNEEITKFGEINFTGTISKLKDKFNPFKLKGIANNARRKMLEDMQNIEKNDNLLYVAENPEDEYIAYNFDSGSKVKGNFNEDHDNVNYDNEKSNEIDDKDYADEATMFVSDIIKHTNRRLLSLAEHENIEIEKFPFIIGKIKNRVDYCFDRKTISRMHVKFYWEDDRYFVEDLNSKNGTYVNDKEIEPLVLEEIKIGDYISLGDYKFVFR